jgi:hypothetical protein
MSAGDSTKKIIGVPLALIEHELHEHGKKVLQASPLARSSNTQCMLGSLRGGVAK